MAKMCLDQYIQCVGGEISPQVINNAAANGAWVPLANYRSAMIHCRAGAIAAGGALAWQVREATDGAGTAAQNLAGYTAAHADTAPNTTQTITLLAEVLSAGYTHIQIQVTETGVQNVNVSAAVIRENCRYPQATLPA